MLIERALKFLDDLYNEYPAPHRAIHNNDRELLNDANVDLDVSDNRNG